MALIRRVVYCEACGASVGLDEDKCPNCGCFFEPLIEYPYKLKSGSSNPNAFDDASKLKPFVEMFESFGYVLPRDIDALSDVIKAIKVHEYPFRYYVIDLLSLAHFYRSICLDRTKESRETQLELFKRLEAVYFALTR